MPKLSGFGLIKELGRQQISILSIIITAYGDEKLLKILTQYGCMNLIEKPFEDKTLIAKVESVLSNNKPSTNTGRLSGNRR